MRRILNLIRSLGRKKKAALVLSSGAARGLAHIGVIKALKEENARIDLIVGTSMGALIGACYAKNKDISEFEELVLKIDWKRLLQLADFSLAFVSGGFIHGQKVTKLLRTIIGDITFADLEIPLAVIATDANTGEEIIIRDGSVAEAVRASISMPVIFVPVRLKNRFLIDGGIVNPLPIDVAKEMGAGFVISSNALPNPKQLNFTKLQKDLKTKIPKAVLNEPSLDKHTAFSVLNNQLNALINEAKDKMRHLQEYINDFKNNLPADSENINANSPGIFDIFAQAFYIMQYEVIKSKLGKADIQIDPDTAHISSLEFYRSEEFILEGYTAAKKALLSKKIPT